ncbi:hypothetical protein [Kitasatospora sp. NBC_01539]|uniref:hypothetical protein n=1 Tax=Kitasatospora sp. NBC_01539 TaxID=2903577 RepID=UPI0038602135
MDARTAVVPRRTRRRRTAGPAGLVIAALALAGCGSAAGTGAAPGTGVPSSAAGTVSPVPSASPSDPAATPVPSSPVPTASPQPGQPTGPGIAVGEPAPTAASLPATGYALKDGTHLTVVFQAGVCEKYGLRADEQAPGLVRVRVVVTQPAPRGTACTAVVETQSVGAQLASPLGDRKVVDMASGTTLTVRGDVPGGPR